MANLNDFYGWEGGGMQESVLAKYDSPYIQGYLMYFNIMYKNLTKDYDPHKYFENDLDKLCDVAERNKNQLFGMLELLVWCEKLTSEEDQNETDRIISTFSTITLFRCYYDKERTVMTFGPEEVADDMEDIDDNQER